MNNIINKIQKVKEYRLGKYGILLSNILNVMKKNVTDECDFYLYDDNIAIKHFKHKNIIHFNLLIFDDKDYIDYSIIYMNIGSYKKIIKQHFPESSIYFIIERKPQNYVVLGDKIVDYNNIINL